ncbi:MAG: hypothetical protein ACAI38_10505 [Myxococcota bacterium]|nr:hypothetical protein [Myxococcota bacterium]
MIKRIEPIAAVQPVQAAGATPTYSTATNPPSIRFNIHPHTLTLTGEQIEAAAAKPAGTVTVFAVGGNHPHNLNLTTEEAQALVRDGKVQSKADGGHTHIVNFQRQASGDVTALIEPAAPAAPGSLRRAIASQATSGFPQGGITIKDPLHYFVRSSVDGQYMGRGFKAGEQRAMVVTDTATGSTFTFDFGAYDPSFAKTFLYFQGFDENKKEMCFVVPMSFFKEQAASLLPTANAVTGPVHKTFTLEWFAKHAPNKLTRIPGVLVYQDLPLHGRFAVQCTGQVWDEAVKPPTDLEYIPKAGSFADTDEIWLTPLYTPTTPIKIPSPLVGNVQLNDQGDRVVAQRIVGSGAEAKCEFVVYEVRGEVAPGGTPSLHEVYKLAAQADKADMLGHNLLTFERRAGAERSEVVLHDIRKGKDIILASAKPDCVYKFPHFVAEPNGGGIEVRFVEQQWTKDAAGNYTGATNVFKSVRIVN